MRDFAGVVSRPTLQSQFSCAKFGFTLAEVLITLAVIGVVAALTLPAAITNHRKKAAAAKLVQTVSILEQAIKRAEADKGPYNDWDCQDGDARYYGDIYLGGYGRGCLAELVPYIKGVKVFGEVAAQNRVMCFSGKDYQQYKWLDGSAINSDPLKSSCTNSIQLPNGSCIGYNGWAWCGSDLNTFIIDIDGSYQGYNQAGKDLFLFVLDDKYRVKPYGYHWETDELTAQSNHACTKKGGVHQGKVCAAKVVLDGWTMKKDYPW